MQQTRQLSRTAILELLTTKPTAPAVTIYLPTHRSASPPNMNEDQIRARNLFHKAIDILKNTDDGQLVSDQLVAQLAAMEADNAFWEHLSEGLLLVVRPNLLQMFQLPINTEEYVSVADHFHLAPIFGLLETMPRFYVVDVALHEPFLCEGSVYGLERSNIQLPKNPEVGLNLDETNRKTEQQRSSGGGGGTFNGRGGAKSPAEEDRHRFWQLLDTLITQQADTKLPLILAGTDNEIAEYRSVAKYPKILQSFISGAQGGSSERDLFISAQQVIHTELTGPVQTAVIGEYKRAKGQAPDQALKDTAAIDSAAAAGRVDKLLLGSIRSTTDNVQDSMNPVAVLTFPPEDIAQLVQDIAQTVFKSAGTIVNVDQADMPEQNSYLLATLRY